ncbi:flagellar hook-associated protein FlgK [Methylorubrum populi]|uniref:Flagellar hook-associated protein 1 n=1 Tax=Methylorubrum populi TaxID=223967 RepID=A0A160P9J8_9HYPH|nr:flagellar hook-associated protein FlgK [Methylorubrum populi]BAU89309.1 flagellar hook-associated protein FlgK [Methylorubrum populi]
MGLTLALNTARASLLATSNQIAVSARNVAGANDPGYSRKIASLVAGSAGGATVTITRAGDPALYARTLAASSDAARGDALLTGLTKLAQTIGDTDDPTAPAARLSTFKAALQAAANQPDNPQLARDAVEAAKALAGSLNQAADTVHAARAEADAGIADSVDRINDLLVRFDAANRAVVKLTALGADATDALDDRDRILTALSSEIGVTAVNREGGDMALYTDGGVTLFERGPRTVAFSPTSTFVAGTVGGTVTIDGVPVTGSASPMPLASGRIAGLASLRDGAALSYEAQLDALAGGLIGTFAEKDAVPPYGASLSGLFTAGARATLPDGTAAGRNGLAAAIAINAAVDPAQGGDLTLLRSGGMNGSDYADPGAAGDAAYSGRLRDLVTALSAPQPVDPALGLGTASSLTDLAAASAGWLEAQRKDATTNASYQKTLLSRANEALSNTAGVNGDDETALALQLERSYSASAKLISVVNDLLKTLLDAVR